MGIDFIRRAAPNFTKAWNRGKELLTDPTLFTRYPECRSRTVIADLMKNSGLTAGIEVIVCVNGSNLILVIGNTKVGVINRPPSDLLKAIHDVGDCVLGRISRINSLSGTADVKIE